MLGYPPQTFKTSFYPPQNKKLGRPWTVGNVYLLGCLRRRGGGGLFVLGEGNLPQKDLKENSLHGRTISVQWLHPVTLTVI